MVREIVWINSDCSCKPTQFASNIQQKLCRKDFMQLVDRDFGKEWIHVGTRKRVLCFVDDNVPDLVVSISK